MSQKNGLFQMKVMLGIGLVGTIGPSHAKKLLRAALRDPSHQLHDVLCDIFGPNLKLAATTIGSVHTQGGDVENLKAPEDTK